MDEAMVEVAEQDEVREVVGTAARPKVNVMGSRPVDLAVAPRKATTSISLTQRPTHRRRDYPRRPADVDHHGVG
jgi:hypothetical protein